MRARRPAARGELQRRGVCWRVRRHGRLLLRAAGLRRAPRTHARRLHAEGDAEGDALPRPRTSFRARACAQAPARPRAGARAPLPFLSRRVASDVVCRPAGHAGPWHARGLRERPSRVGEAQQPLARAVLPRGRQAGALRASPCASARTCPSRLPPQQSCPPRPPRRRRSTFSPPPSVGGTGSTSRRPASAARRSRSCAPRRACAPPAALPTRGCAHRRRARSATVRRGVQVRELRRWPVRWPGRGPVRGGARRVRGLLQF